MAKYGGIVTGAITSPVSNMKSGGFSVLNAGSSSGNLSSNVEIINIETGGAAAGAAYSSPFKTSQNIQMKFETGFSVSASKEHSASKNTEQKTNNNKFIRKKSAQTNLPLSTEADQPILAQSSKEIITCPTDEKDSQT